MSTGRVSVVVASDDGGSRGALLRALEAEGDISVVAQTTAAMAARATRTLRPDLLAVDLAATPAAIDAGLAVIDQVMAHSPVPVLVLHPRGGDGRLPGEAIAAGALECIVNPRSWGEDDARRLRGRVRMLRRVTVVRHTRGRLLGGANRGMPVVGIAASTGGPPALARVLGQLEGLRAAVLLVQHIDERFLAGFVELLRRSSALPVEVATAGMALREGWVHVAPPGVHLGLGGSRRVALAAEPPSIHRPSADVLFRSIAEHAGGSGIGVVLTGMGDDGAAGLLALQQRGGVVIAQDEASCAVFGMPRAAQQRGAVDRLTALDLIAAAVRSAAAGAAR
ncbi:MAG TPA: CheB methylesterase domain-containing protein [Candidatus Dormibacteraeota bacterium]